MPLPHYMRNAELHHFIMHKNITLVIYILVYVYMCVESDERIVI
jgi:hypothetical protein